MKRKIISLLLAIAMLALPLLATTSCGLFGEEDDGKLHITFYHTMGANLTEVLDQYKAIFEKRYPNVVIDHKQVGGYDDVRDQIKTDILTGEQPNIAYCYPDHVALYNKANVVLPLDDMIASTDTVTYADGTTEQVGLTQAQIDNFIDAYYNEGKIYGDGKMYTLPMSKSTEVLYYNKDFFAKHNLEVPTTWVEMEEVCAKIKAIEGDCIPLGYDSESNWFITMCEQMKSDYTSATGEHFLFDNETNRNFIATFRSWYEKGYVTTQEISGAYTSKLFTMNSAEKGNCYMCIGSSAGAAHQIPKDKDTGEIMFEVGIAPIPQYDAENQKAISQGPSLCIFKKASQEEMLYSWLFVKLLTTNEDFQAAFGMASGYMPVLENIGEHPIYKEELAAADGKFNLAMLSAKVALEQADTFYTSPAFNGSSVARDEVGKLVQFCMTDPSAATAAGIKKAFEDAIKECKHQIGQ